MTENKTLIKIAVIGYFILFALAYFFYQERVLWGDLAYHLFEIIRTNTYAIQNERFGAFVTQTTPLIASRLGVSLNAIIVLYSLTFVLYYFGVFALASWLFKSWKIGICILLFNTLMVSNTFFWIQSEYQQGLAVLLLLYAVITQENLKKWTLVLAALLVVSLVYFHPLMPISFLFCCLFFYLDKNQTIARRTLGLVALLFVLVKIAKETILKTPSEYEAQAMTKMDKFKELFPDYFTLDYHVLFFRELISKYQFLAILLILLTYWYFKQKERSKIGLIWTFFIGYLILVNVTHTSMPFVPFYMENLYLPLSLFVIIPFVFDYLPTKSHRQQNIIITSIVVIAIVRIGFCSIPFTKRITWEKDLLAKTSHLPQQKLLIKLNEETNNILQQQEWSTPYEFWLLSTIDNGVSRSIFIHRNPEEFNYAVYTKNKALITNWANWGYEDLNDNLYFNFQDTSFYKSIPF